MRMQFDLLPALIEDAHLATIPAHPDHLADVFGWNGIIGLIDLDITVPVNGALAFLKTREEIRWQGQQSFLFLSKERGHLLTGRAVDPHIGHGLFPVPQKLIMRAQTGKGATTQGIALEVTDP